MLPKIILHNSISLDGSLINFDVNMELHYKIVSSYKPDAHLIGSQTIKKGLELYGGNLLEEDIDYEKPIRDKKLPYWFIIDTKGALLGKLHEIRRFEFCKDVIILISKETTKQYINYLKKRHYDYYIVGNKKVDLNKALDFISREYSIKILVTDTGRILGNILINAGLITEISLLVHPIIIGSKGYYIFGNIKKNLTLNLVKYKVLNEKYIWLVYNLL
jgi:2,5-diamino-6-(ribosylamino)-4(3H)-pyrimidinone 5'-phosphate reductase